MDVNEMHRRSQQVFGDVLAQASDADLAKPTPCDDWSVGDLVAHVIDGNRHVAEMLDAGDPEPAADGDLQAAHREASIVANRAFDDPDLASKTMTLPFGEIPAVVFATIRSGDLYAHAWDLAVAIGADRDLDRELGEAIFAATAPVLTLALRGDGGPFGAEQPCPPDLPVADRMAAFLGRRVPIERPS